MSVQEGSTSVDSCAKYPDLTDDEKWLITLGGIFSTVIKDNTNTIEMKCSNGEIRETLRSDWYISDRASFEQVIVELATSDKRVLYANRFSMIKRFLDVLDNSNIICRSISKMYFPFAMQWHQIRTKEDLKKTALELGLDRLNKTNTKKNEDLIKILSDAETWTKELEVIGDYRSINSLVAWDAVYLVYLVRCAIQLEYIERKDFVKFAGALKEQVQATYNNWNEVALAYVIGKCMQKYSEDKIKNVTHVTKQYLDNRNTLVHIVRFK